MIAASRPGPAQAPVGRERIASGKGGATGGTERPPQAAAARRIRIIPGELRDALSQARFRANERTYDTHRREASILWRRLCIAVARVSCVVCRCRVVRPRTTMNWFASIGVGFCCASLMGPITEMTAVLTANAPSRIDLYPR
jgi:hypothetical protein